MDYSQLRSMLRPLVEGLKDVRTHAMLPVLCEELGLPAPDYDGSKRERMTAPRLQPAHREDDRW